MKIRLTAVDSVEAQVKRDIAALNKLDAAATKAATKVRGMGHAERIANKALPGGGLGNAIGAALGGGLGGTLAAGGAFFALGGIRSLVNEAMDLDEAAEGAQKRLSKLTEWTDGAVDSLSYVGQAFQGVFAGLRKVAAETLGVISGLLIGTAGTIAQKIGEITGWKRMSNAGEDLLNRAVQTLPVWMGGLGGTGEQGVAEAEDKLKKAQERRKRARRSDSGSSTPGFAVPADELAKIGLFRGGGGESLTALQKQANKNLELIHRSIEDLALEIAEEI